MPRWLAEIDQLASVCAQFVVTGNVRDSVLLPRDGRAVLDSTPGAILTVLEGRGIGFLLVYSPHAGFRRLARDGDQDPRRAFEALGLDAAREPEPDEEPLGRLLEVARAVANAAKVPCALVIDYASHITRGAQGAEALLEGCEVLAETSRELRGFGDGRVARRNPVIWLFGTTTDVPSWFGQGSPRIRHLIAELPNRRAREQLARRIGADLAEGASATPAELDRFATTLADLTDGLPLKSVVAIGSVAIDKGYGLAQVADAVSAFKAGVSDNPWRDPAIFRKIAAARADLARRVIGQDRAIGRVVDVLMRSVTGLSGAHTSTRGGRPRGVLFFAGPTGVGKTELAKAITQQLFGDERAYQRFDMSEFSEEHSASRLVGSPPGYVGNEQGGELVNAVRQRPFSLFLFDEIEKAHKRILDKFLQILEDGRLTDGRGETVFFSDAIIVFTSNLGIYEAERAGTVGRRRIANPEDPPDVTERRVLDAIREHFRSEIGRPELLNRIGDNVIVFGFIQPGPAERILAKMLGNLHQRVQEEFGLRLDIGPAALEAIKRVCLGSLEDGGRGIGNKLETVLINPLARALFALPDAGRRLDVTAVGMNAAGEYEVVLA